MLAYVLVYEDPSDVANPSDVATRTPPWLLRARERSRRRRRRRLRARSSCSGVSSGGPPESGTGSLSEKSKNDGEG